MHPRKPCVSGTPLPLCSAHLNLCVFSVRMPHAFTVAVGETHRAVFVRACVSGEFHWFPSLLQCACG